MANIWRFPYIVGQNGGSAFLLVFLICLLLIGIPVFITEILIGRSTRFNPSAAFEKLSGSKKWAMAGKMTILTGFLVSSFYAAVAGWIFGYLIEACKGELTHFTSAEQASVHFAALSADPIWTFSTFATFVFLATGVLYFGVKDGIERGNKIMMPALFVILLLIWLRALFLPGAVEGIVFLLTPDWSMLGPAAVLTALGQSFFTLSLGQGTMVTYGSYLGKRDNLVQSCLWVVGMDLLISLLAAAAIFSVVFFAGAAHDSGPALFFHTLPLVFSKLPGGNLFAIFFFLLVFLAALTSQISAMEPAIAYIIDRRAWSRKWAVCFIGIAVLLAGIPSALSTNIFADSTLFGMTPLTGMSFLCSNILIPFGGFAAVVLVGWSWGIKQGVEALQEGAEPYFKKNKWLTSYFWFCIKYLAPVLIGVVFIHAIL